jgi:hypothetical protein
MAGIWVTGDLHGEIDIHKLNKKNLGERFDFSGSKDENFMIICGDFGLIWEWQGESKEEKYWLDWLNTRPFTVLFVDGNHENYDRLLSDEYPIVEWHGGKVQKIRENVIHLMRGEIYDILGKTFWTFGGASSHDVKDGILDPEKDKALIKEWSRDEYCRKQFRINHRSWWKEEMASPEEMSYGVENLVKYNDTVDFIITHCAPQTIASMIGCREPDTMTTFLNTIAHTVDFRNWFFGHYHHDARIMSKFYCLYNDILQIA